MGVYSGPTIKRDSMYLCIDADNIKSYPESGNTIFDLGPNYANGTLTQGNSIGVGPYYDANGSIYFDGNNDHITIASPNSLLAWSPTGNTFNSISLEIVVKTTDTSGMIISKPWNGNGEYNYYVEHNNFQIRIGATYNKGFTSIATGNWVHFIGVITPTQVGVYINGNLDSSFSNHNITQNDPSFGNDNYNLTLMTLFPYSAPFNYPTHAIQGNVALFRFYNTELTANEAKKNFYALKSRFGL